MSSIFNSAGIGGALANNTLPQSNSQAKSATVSFADTLTAVDKFLKYQDMSPAEKFRASYLAEKGLTEDDLAKMSPEDRLKIENEIAEKIKQKLAQSVGSRAG